MTTLRSAVLLLPLLFAGCLEVESMEIQVVADRANDRLDVMIVSRGVFSSATNEQNLQKDLADLMKCRDVAAVPMPGLGVVDFTDPAKGDTDAKWQRNAMFFDIEAGAFFIDEQGRLSFYQFLRINRAKEFAALAGQQALEQMAADRRTTPATQELVAAAIRDGLQVITIDGAGFVFRRPLAEAEHKDEQIALWRGVVRGVEKALTKEDGAERTDATERGHVQMLRDNDAAIVRRQGVTEYYIGTQGSDACDYQLRGPAYRDNLLQAFIVNEPRPPHVTQALVDKQFAAFHGRQARVPEAYAAAKRRLVGAASDQVPK